LKKQKIFNTNKVINLSNKNLTSNHLSVLNKGLTFVPSKYKTNISTLNEELRLFERRLQLHYFFETLNRKKEKQKLTTLSKDSNKNITEVVPFSKNPHYWPPTLNKTITQFCTDLKKEIILMNTKTHKDNLTKAEREALIDLRKDENITIKKGDKGAGLVVLNTSDYIDKVMTQLNDTNTYKRKEIDDTITVKQKADKIIQSLYNSKHITFKQRRYLTNFKPKTPIFYGIPKIHKQGTPLRPIVSQIDGPTTRINELVDYYLSFAEKTIPNLLQDTTSFLNILHKYENEMPITENTYLITLDVTSLYTNIPHIEGSEWVSDYYDTTKGQWSDTKLPLITKSQLRECILFILTNTTFTFNGELFQQLFGTTMGAKFSVKFANIYMHVLLQKFIKQYEGQIPPFIARLVDDIFLLWNSDLDTINRFITSLNKFHPSIKFEAKLSKDNIQFLDTVVYKKDNKLFTKLFIKPTDCKQYLHYHSSHPQHVKRAIPYSQALRYRRIITEDEELYSSLINLKQKFLDRHYPILLVNEQIDKVKLIDRSETLTYKTKENKQQKLKQLTSKDNFLPLILTYHPNHLKTSSSNIHRLLSKEWERFTNENDELRDIFSNATLRTVFKRGQTLGQLLISSAFPPRWQRKKTDDDDITNLLALFLAENEQDKF